MPATNKSKTNSVNTKKTPNKNSKSGMGLLNVVPTSKARDKAKDIDFNRRGDAESNEL